MRGFEIVAIVIGVFFVIGIAVGKLLAVRFPARGHALERPQPRQIHGWRCASGVRLRPVLAMSWLRSTGWMVTVSRIGASRSKAARGVDEDGGAVADTEQGLLLVGREPPSEPVAVASPLDADLADQ
jgi:hypothetical protein